MTDLLSAKTLGLPKQLVQWIGDAPLRASSGESGAQTIWIGKGSGAYLKIAGKGRLAVGAMMQEYLHQKGFSPAVIASHSLDRDYLLVEAAKGRDGIDPIHLEQPERLSALFGKALRRLHEAAYTDCPVQDRMNRLLQGAPKATYAQRHLDLLAPYIGPAQADAAAREIAVTRASLKADALIHGDYCLPNIMIHNWAFSALIDVADAGAGDRHYDLAWGLWTIRYNLRHEGYGHLFLDAYGRDQIDTKRLRICGLLAAMD